MAIAYNTSIARNGLILCLDSGNLKSIKGRRNVLSWTNWIVGTGGVTGYPQNGDGNSRLIDTTPFGGNDIVWQTLNNDVASDEDGGWNGANFTIDPTKTYRYTTWVRRKVLGNGSFYLGPHSNWSSVPGQFILNRSNGQENINPYFYSGNWWNTSTEWFLVVGHVWAAGSGTGSDHPDSGIYTVGGTKVANCTDYMWAPSNTTSFHRSYLYYSTDPTTNQQWYQPRVDICDGTEPTLAELRQDIGNRWLDLSGNGYNATFFDSAHFSNNSIVLDGNAARLHVSSPNDRLSWTPSGGGLNSMTVDLWVKTTDTNGNILSKPWNGNGEYNWRIFHGGFLYQIGAQSGSLSFNTLATGNWEHLCFVINSTQFAAYRNGILNTAFTNHNCTTNTPTSGNSNVELCLMSLYPYGSGWSGNTGFSNSGELSNLKIYNRVLSAQEVLQNFNAIRGRYGV